MKTEDDGTMKSFPHALEQVSRKSSRWQRDARQRFERCRGGPLLRSHLGDLVSLDEHLRRDEGHGCQAAEGARGREQAPEKDRRRSSARHRLVGRDRVGKLLTPALSSPMWSSYAPLRGARLCRKKSGLGRPADDLQPGNRGTFDHCIAKSAEKITTGASTATVMS